MPQTLLALLALVVASLMSFNVRDSTKGTYQHQYEDEFEMTAAAVALQVVETAEERPFDQRTTTAGMTAANDFLPVGPPEYSMWNTFGGTPCNLDSLWTTTACDDLDDLNGITRQLVPFELRNTRDAGTGTPRARFLPMDVSVDVEYVLDEPPHDVESALPTNHKRVTVTVFLDESVSTPRNRDVPLLTVQRIVSYDCAKARRDFERSTTPSRDVANPSSC